MRQETAGQAEIHTDNAARKRELRKAIRRLTAELSRDYCQEADAAICRQVIELQEYREAQTVFCFVGTEREIDTTMILEDALRSGKRLGVPLCLIKGEMEVREIRSLDELKPGQYGILEPDRECPLIQPQEIGFAILPCLSCDREGRRLGHGGGYYDRYLSRSGKSLTAAVICREQLMCEELPTEEHDRRAEFVVCESGSWRV